MSDKKEKDEAGQEVPVTAEDDGKLRAVQANDSPPAPAVEETPKPAKNEKTQSEKKEIGEATDKKNTTSLEPISKQPAQDSSSDEPVVKPATETTTNVPEPTTADAKTEAHKLLPNKKAADEGTAASASQLENVEPTGDAKTEPSKVPQAKTVDVGQTSSVNHNETVLPPAANSDMKSESGSVAELKNKANEKDVATPTNNGNPNAKNLFLLDDSMSEGGESGTEEDQSAFMKELENFFRERTMEFKPPKFYGEGLNCLKLWRAVTRLGGYDKVTSCKLWRQVGESFKPPKTCTTVSWTFRGFYEKALLDYERHHIRGGELSVPISSNSEALSIDNQASGSGRARRDAAARAMQGWHSQRLLGNGEVSDPIIKDKNAISLQKREKIKNIGLLKRKKPPYMDHAVKAARTKTSKSQLDTAVVDVGPPADWVKINVQKTKDCYEVYALVPGLLREEVRVQSDPAGRLVISGEPEHPDNPWGVTPFKKIVSLPSRIDPHQTSAVVTLHGQLFVRVPFEPSE